MSRLLHFCILQKGLAIYAGINVKYEFRKYFLFSLKINIVLAPDRALIRICKTDLYINDKVIELLLV